MVIKMKKFLFIGGDKRQQYAAQYLMQQGHSVITAEDCPEFDKMVGEADYIVLPLPVSRDGVRVNSPLSVAPLTLKKVIRALDESKTVFAGMPDKETTVELECKDIKLYDYYKNEALTILNSISTAEGVIHEAIGSMNINLHGSKAAVFGYGKASSALARRLVALGAQVWAFARSERDRAYAESDRCKAVKLDRAAEENIGFDLVVNTVPAPVIDEKFIKTLPKSCLIIEIASAPYGVDFAAAEANGIRVIRSPSLPGRYSPKSAGEAIARTILNTISLNEKGGKPK